jgi:hypothetical protein
MLNDARIQVGSVVQIDPAHDDRFGACLLLVTELKGWGVQGYVRIPGRGDAYYRVPFDMVSYVGPATWVHEEQHAEPIPEASDR